MASWKIIDPNLVAIFDFVPFDDNLKIRNWFYPICYTQKHTFTSKW